jgi:uncharacterized protein YneF (UPF0154 family)
MTDAQYLNIAIIMILCIVIGIFAGIDIANGKKNKPKYNDEDK